MTKTNSNTSSGSSGSNKQSSCQHAKYLNSNHVNSTHTFQVGDIIYAQRPEEFFGEYAGATNYDIFYTLNINQYCLDSCSEGPHIINKPRHWLVIEVHGRHINVVPITTSSGRGLDAISKSKPLEEEMLSIGHGNELSVTPTSLVQPTSNSFVKVSEPTRIEYFKNMCICGHLDGASVRKLRSVRLRMALGLKGDVDEFSVEKTAKLMRLLEAI